MKFAKFFLFLLLVACSITTAQDRQNEPQRVLLISIDGLRPDFYTKDEFETPTLKQLAASGAFAKGALTVFPSVTYPSHTTIATGVSPAKHGVLSNTIFTWKDGPTPAWYWEAKAIRVPTLWQRAKAAGKTTAIVRWPVSVGADVDWLLPEIFSIEPKVSDWDLFLKYTKKELVEEVFKGMNAEIKEVKGFEQADVFTAGAAAYLLKKHQPNLTLVHLVNVDHVQHMTGPDSKETREAVKVIDRHIKTILEAVDLKTTCVIVTGDHGFFAFTKTVNINTLFVKEGWIEAEKSKIKSWKAIAHVSGGQAAIYSTDKSLHEKIVQVLKQNAGTIYNVIERKQLDDLHAYPEAVCAIEAQEGYALSGGVRGELVVEHKSTEGQHGYLPTHPKLYTGFIAAGAGIKPGTKLDLIRLLDIAPTVAKMLKFDMPDVEGKVLEMDK